LVQNAELLLNFMHVLHKILLTGKTLFQKILLCFKDGHFLHFN